MATHMNLKQFHEDGFVIFPGLLTPDIVAGVQRDLEAYVDRLADRMVEQGYAADRHQNEPWETRFGRIFEHCPDRVPTVIREELHMPGMYPLFFHDAVLDSVEEIIGPEIRLYPNYSVRPKLPNHEGTLVLWHQDAAYTQLVHKSGEGDADALRMVNVWTPLVPAREENGCMQMIPGTHRAGVVPHIRPNQYYLEIDSEYLKPELNRAVSLEVDPGDVILFDNRIFHCGLPNRSDGIRWSCDWRYQDAGQSTMRPENGHLARSAARPGEVVKSAAEWARLSFQ